MKNQFWRIIAGFFLIAVGAIILLDRSGSINFDLGDFISDYWPLILIIIGVWMIYEHSRTSSKGAKTTCCRVYSKNFGDLNISPAEIEQSGADYSLMMGNLNINLGETKLFAGENVIKASLNAGDMKIKIPENVICSITASCTAGDINIFGQKRSGLSIDLNYQDDRYSSQLTKLKIIASCSLGNIKIMRRN